MADLKGRRVVVEAKGGIINTSHAGQTSRLRRNLYEAIGMLLDGPEPADRSITAVPRHSVTQTIAERIARRCRDIGIEIVLVSGMGSYSRLLEAPMFMGLKITGQH